METSVMVEMPRLVDAGGLLLALTEHGLTADLVNVGGRWELEVEPGADEIEQAATEVSAIIDAWLADCELPFVPMRVGKRAFTVRPPLD